MKDGLRTFIFVVVLAVIGYLLLPYVKTNPKPNQPSQQAVDPLAGKTAGTKLYDSDKLGVRFTYNPKPSENFDVAVTEKDNKVYVHGASDQPEQGQWIEVLTKDPSKTLEEAIANQFLQGYDPKNCFTRAYPSTEQTKTNYVAAGISYPPPTDDTQPFWQNSDKCPTNYSETNAVQYFLMNKDVPGKYVFIKVGQDSITSDGTPITADGSGYNWSHSIEIYK